MSAASAQRHLLVLPAHNEASSLPETIANLDALPREYDLLVVDDGSTDDTSGVARRLAAESHRTIHVLRLEMNCGIGAAVQTGYRFAIETGCYEYVIQFDADGQHDATAIPALVEACQRDGLDLCIGSRFLENPGPDSEQPVITDHGQPTTDIPHSALRIPRSSAGFQSTPLRRAGIRFFARLISLLSGVKVTDPTSGLRCAGPRAWRRFAESYPDDYPEPEVLFWCARNHLKLGEIPVRMHPRAAGVSSIRYLATVYYMLKVTLAILIDRLRRREAD